MDTPLLLEAGAVVDGRYQVKGLLGTGGFAQVFEVEHLRLGTEMAIKVMDIDPSSPRWPEFHGRFLAEAKAAASIRHDNVVTIHDFGVVEGSGRPFIIMERLRGHDLEHELTGRGPLTSTRTIALFDGALDALDAAHRQGIVHKDLKPANLFVVSPGTAAEKLVVMDFGVARIEDADKATATGQTWGTPQYLAPEYIRWQKVTPAVDVYQMGLILAESLLGRPVIESTDPFECIQRHCTGELSLPSGLLDGELGRVIKRATAVDPADRYADAQAFRTDLAKVDPRTVGTFETSRLTAVSADAGGPASTGEGGRPTTGERDRERVPVAAVGIVAREPTLPEAAPASGRRSQPQLDTPREGQEAGAEQQQAKPESRLSIPVIALVGVAVGLGLLLVIAVVGLAAVGLWEPGLAEPPEPAPVTSSAKSTTAQPPSAQEPTAPSPGPAGAVSSCAGAKLQGCYARLDAAYRAGRFEDALALAYVMPHPYETYRDVVTKRAAGDPSWATPARFQCEPAPAPCSPMDFFVADRGGASAAKAAARLRERCEQGDGDACHRVGLLAFRGADPGDKMLPPLASAAKLGDLGARGTYGMQLRYLEKNVERGMSLLDAACAEGNLMACEDLVCGYEVAGRWPEGRALLDRSCQGGHAQACYWLAYFSARHKSVEDPAALYEQACAGGVTHGCEELGILFEKRGKLAEAQSAFQTACTLGRDNSCAWMASVLVDRDIDWPKARRIYRAACEKEVWWACNNLGYQLLKRKEGDRKVALGWYQRACREQHTTGCRNLASERKKADDIDGALAWYDKACKWGDGEACHQQAKLQLDRAKKAEKERPDAWRDALPSLERACELDHIGGCNRLASVLALQAWQPERAVAIGSKACRLGRCWEYTDLLIKLGRFEEAKKHLTGKLLSRQDETICGRQDGHAGTNTHNYTFLRPGLHTVPQDTAKACESGVQVACAAERWVLNGHSRDEFRAREQQFVSWLDDTACDLDYPFACLNLGKVQRKDGRLKESDALLGRSCRAGSGYVCNNYVRILNREGDRRSDALRWAQIGCQGGDPRSCYEWAALKPTKTEANASVRRFLQVVATEAPEYSFQDDPMPSNPADWEASMQLLCDRGQSLACRRLAVWIDATKGKEGAPAHYEKACALGHGPQCERLAAASFRKKDKESGRAYCRKACKAGLTRACSTDP